MLVSLHMNLTSLRLFSINSYGADLTKLQALDKFS